MLTVLAAAVTVPPARAGEAMWIVVGPTISRVPADEFGVTTPGSTKTITGLGGTETVSAIDVRAATGELYLLANDIVPNPDVLRLYKLDPLTGAATAVGPAASLGNNGGVIQWPMDINPVADIARISGPGNRNLRMNLNTGVLLPDDTSLAFAPGDPNFGAGPNVRALGYDASFAGSTSTTLYAVDFTGAGSTPRLLRQGGPGGVPSANSGQLFTVGANVAQPTNGSRFAFDVSGQTGAGYLTYAKDPPNDFAALLRVDLATGTFTPVPGAYQATVRAIALAPTSVLALGTTGVGVPEAGGAVAVPVTRTGPGTGTVTVDYATSDGSATAGSDYTPTSGQLSIPEGQSGTFFTVPVSADTLNEGRESFLVTLSNPRGTNLGGAVLGGPASAVVSIEDDDAPPVLPPVAPDKTAPGATLSGVPSSLTRTNFLKGFKVSVTPTEPAAIDVALQGTTKTATLASYELGLFSKRLGLAAGKRSVTVKPSSKLVGKPRKSVKVRLRVVVTDAAGNAATVDRKVKVKP